MTSNDTSGLRFAVVGSGPAGFYAVDAIQRQLHPARIDLIERLPAPFGLVRYGVAPDHAKLKQVTKVFEMFAALPGVRFLGNVELGVDVTIEELRQRYHAVVLATGAQGRRRLGIEGEELPGSYSAGDFVAWYNGHPDFRNRTFDLSGDTAIVIGQGNVAIDVARILSKPVSELRKTDIATYAVDALAESRVARVIVVGRRGPAQAKFTSKELREFMEISNVTALASESELRLGEMCEVELRDPMRRSQVRIVDLFREFSAQSVVAGNRHVEFRFYCEPHRIVGTQRVEAIEFERMQLQGNAFAQRGVGTGTLETIACGSIFASVGYRGVEMAGVPYDPKAGTIRNIDGRVCDADKSHLAGLYCTGWIKRGPSGVIGTNRNDSMATVEKLIEDVSGERLPQPQLDSDITDLLSARNVRFLDFSNWKRIDVHEQKIGDELGKVREKLTSIGEFLPAAV